METKYTLKKSKFIDWYFDDGEDKINLSNGVIEDLHIDGKSTITVQGLFDMTGYIPDHILEEEVDDDYDETCIDLIKLI